MRPADASECGKLCGSSGVSNNGYVNGSLDSSRFEFITARGYDGICFEAYS